MHVGRVRSSYDYDAVLVALLRSLRRRKTRAYEEHTKRLTVSFDPTHVSL